MNKNHEIVLNDIKENFKDSKYSTSQLLDNTGLDKNDARDSIKNKTQRSLSNYIRFYRLNHAQNILKKGKKNISEVAYDSGFSSLSYFSKSFKDEFGYSPNASLNNVKLIRQFRSTMISIIQNKTSLSYLFSGILLIFIIILVIPRISLVDNSEKINTKLMLNDYSRINKIPYNDLLTNDTIVISSKIRSYDIYWRTTDIYKWVGLNKINDSTVLFSSKMKSIYFQVKLEKEGKESFQYFTSANNLINVNISLDDKMDQDGVYFPAMELYLPNTNYSRD
jgi:AraC-like DNA-binding protein